MYTTHSLTYFDWNIRLYVWYKYSAPCVAAMTRRKNVNKKLASFMDYYAFYTLSESIYVYKGIYNNFKVIESSTFSREYLIREL